MITVSFGSYSATLRSVTLADDRREFDQSMIVRRTRGNNLIAYRDSNWHDFDTVIIDSKHNIAANAEDFKTLLQLAHGQIIEVEVEYITGEACSDVHKVFTGIITTPMVEIITIQDDCSYDIRFELLIETETIIPIIYPTVVASGGDSYYDITIGVNTYRVHLFTGVGSGDFVVTTGGYIEYLVVAGGGGSGGQGSGGGAGGLIHTFGSPSDISPGTFAAVVGDGGDPGQSYNDFLGRSGGNSSFWGNTAVGGGGGRAFGFRRGNGQNGGSGGGATAYNQVGVTYTGGVATSGQGMSGGSALASNTTSTSGGGGGAGGAGGSAETGGTLHGDGGVGIDLSDYVGALVGDGGWFAGGGAGRSVDASGGNGGGGEMSENDGDGQSNTGGGGGGNNYGLGKGGSGIVLIRYLIG